MKNKKGCCPVCGKPHGSCGCGCHKPTPIPPLPPPHCGSPYENDKFLYQKMQECINAVNNLLCGADSTLKAIESRAVNIGGYYDPKTVSVKEGYSGEDGSAYWLTRIRSRDQRCSPVFMELHLAYNDTTNSGTKEDIMHASNVELADKMWPAMQFTDAGWFGHVRQRGIPLPSNITGEYEGYFTVGFTRSGRMKWYANTVNPSQLSRDQIENSMGCYGITAINGEFTDASYRQYIPKQTEKVGRVLMGQNPETKDVYIISTGSYENTQGMLTKTCTDILLGYGCTTVAEVATDAASAMTDKGALLYAPLDNNVPRLNAFWFISRKRHFTNDYQYELATLMQKWGAQQWQLYLLRQAVTDMQDQVTDHGNRIDNLEDRVTALEQWRATVEAKLVEIDGELAALDAKIDAEIERAKAAEKKLQDQIDAHAVLITEIQEKLQKEIDDRIAAVQDLQNKLDIEIQARIDGDQALQDLYDDLSARVNQLELDLTALKQTVDTNYNTVIELITQLRADLSQVQQWYTDLQASVTAIDNMVTGIIESINQIKQTLVTIEEWKVSIDEWRITVDSALTNLDERVTIIEGEVITINNTLTDHTERIETIETKVDSIPEGGLPEWIGKEAFVAPVSVVTAANFPFSGVTGGTWNVSQVTYAPTGAYIPLANLQFRLQVAYANGQGSLLVTGTDSQWVNSVDAEGSAGVGASGLGMNAQGTATSADYGCAIPALASPLTALTVTTPPLYRAIVNSDVSTGTLEIALQIEISPTGNSVARGIMTVNTTEGAEERRWSDGRTYRLQYLGPQTITYPSNGVMP